MMFSPALRGHHLANDAKLERGDVLQLLEIITWPMKQNKREEMFSSSLFLIREPPSPGFNQTSPGLKSSSGTPHGVIC